MELLELLHKMRVYHIRKASRPEPHQAAIYTALGLPHLPGPTEKTLVDPAATQMS